MNIVEWIVQLCFELVKTLFTEELSRLVRDRAARLFRHRGQSPLTAVEQIHVRVRSRLFHRLRTGKRRKL